MKKIKVVLLLSTLACGFTLQSCFYHVHDDNVAAPYYQYDPIYMSRADLESSIKMSEPRAMQNAGKIYVKDQHIFITDENKGFHIYNNSNPNAPALIAFLEVTGATDMAIKNNSIYINQAVDLVAVSITNNQVTVHKRIKNTFPSKVSPDGYIHYAGENEIIVDWKKN